MEIMHHFGLLLSSDDDRQVFLDIGIELEPGVQMPRGGPVSVGFDISEEDPRWEGLKRLPPRFRSMDTVYTKFLKTELEAATAFVIYASSPRGYPEPSDQLGYLKATYDLSEYCHRCGIGGRQIRPFRLKSRPSLKREMMQLNWVFDEYFVSPEVWSSVFAPHSIDCWPVVLNGTGREIDTVVQLKISDLVDLQIKDLSFGSCDQCGRKKARLLRRGFSPAPVGVVTQMSKSTHWFGSGACAYKLILVPSLLYREIGAASLRRVTFYPCRATMRSGTEGPGDERNPT